MRHFLDRKKFMTELDSKEAECSGVAVEGGLRN